MQELPPAGIRKCIGYAVLVYTVLLLMHGYQFGIGDVAEVASLAKYFNDNTLYPNDLFISDVQAMQVSPRTFISYLISLPGSDYIELTSFLLHIFSSLLLLSGIFRFASRYIASDSMLLLLPLVVSGLTMELNAGGHDLYGNSFGGSNLAEGIGIWAIVFLREKNVRYVAVLTTLMTLAHPLVGVQFFAVALLYLSFLSIKKEYKYTTPALFLIFYLLTGGIYVLMQLKGQYTPTGLTDQQYIQIAYYFRHPHHFVVQYFPKKGALMMGVLSLVFIPFFYRRDLFLFVLSTIIILGCFVFALGTAWLQIYWVYATEWFRATIWIKLFLFIAVFVWLQEKGFFLKGKVSIPISFAIGSLLFIGAYKIPNSTLPIGLQLPGKSFYDPEIEIAEKAKLYTPKVAVIVHPFSMSALKYFGERTSYVEMKCIPLSKSGFEEWYRRMGIVYGLDTTLSVKGFKMESMANEYFYHTDQQKLDLFRREGITHVIQPASIEIPNLEKLAENEKFTLYKL